MISDEILSEVEFKRKFLRWRLKNDIGMTVPRGENIDDYASVYPMPDFDYVHTQSFADENGDLISLLKSSYHLSGWMTRNGKNAMDFTFYLVLRTMTDSPEVEPFPVGYIVVE